MLTAAAVAASTDDDTEMIGEQIRQLTTEPRDLRKFGWLVGGVFALLAFWWWRRGDGRYVYPLAPAVALIIFGTLWPRSLKWIYISWMAAGLAMGLVVSTFLLTLMFYLVVTPMALLARCAGKDFLQRRVQRDAKSYWISRKQAAPRSIERYERQF